MCEGEGRFFSITVKLELVGRRCPEKKMKF